MIWLVALIATGQIGAVLVGPIPDMGTCLHFKAEAEQETDRLQAEAGQAPSHDGSHLACVMSSEAPKVGALWERAA